MTAKKIQTPLNYLVKYVMKKTSASSGGEVVNFGKSFTFNQDESNEQSLR